MENTKNDDNKYERFEHALLNFIERVCNGKDATAVESEVLPAVAHWLIVFWDMA